jgi:hypothetical protein
VTFSTSAVKQSSMTDDKRAIKPDTLLTHAGSHP